MSGRRPSRRPTYKYFSHLVHDTDLGNSNINARTGVVYRFYEYLSKQVGYDIDIDRVDTTRTINLLMKNEGRTFTKTVKKRSQTRSISSASTPVRVGFVLDEGEELRPLSNKHFDDLIQVLHGDGFDVDERLMCLIAVFTGARKQTILTMRMKHFDAFTADNLSPDGTYPIYVGRNSDADTKNNKRQILYFPKWLAEQIIIYANSKTAKKRREKFRRNVAEGSFSDEQIYLFLSNQGNCHYMAKNDYRYAMKKSRPSGQRTKKLTSKLFKYLPDDFPQDFTFHWLRATFAYQYYQYLMPLREKGMINAGEEITRVQARMHHAQRKTTENYLKLFLNINDRVKMQEMYENELFAEYQDGWGIE